MSEWSAWDAQNDPNAQRVNDAIRPVVARSGVDAVHGVTPLMEVCAMEEHEEDSYEEGFRLIEEGWLALDYGDRQVLVARMEAEKSKEGEDDE